MTRGESLDLLHGLASGVPFVPTAVVGFEATHRANGLPDAEAIRAFAGSRRRGRGNEAPSLREFLAANHEANVDPAHASGLAASDCCRQAAGGRFLAVRDGGLDVRHSGSDTQRPWQLQIMFLGTPTWLHWL